MNISLVLLIQAYNPVTDAVYSATGPCRFAAIKKLAPHASCNASTLVPPSNCDAKYWNKRALKIIAYINQLFNGKIKLVMRFGDYLGQITIK